MSQKDANEKNMNYREAMDAYAIEAQLEREEEQRMRDAYRALGLHFTVTVALPGVEGLTYRERIRAQTRELKRSHVVLIHRHGDPLDTFYIIAGETSNDLLARFPAMRPGPNGPIDSVQWLRGGPER